MSTGLFQPRKVNSSTLILIDLSSVAKIAIGQPEL
jgi:hypothetical protein